MSRKRNKIGTIDIGTDLQIAIFVAIGVGGYVLYKYLSPNPDGSTTSGKSSQSTALPPATVAQDLSAQVSAGNGPNYDATQYATWAADIFNAGNTMFPPLADDKTVLGIMNNMDNLADVYSLIQSYGTKNGNLGWGYDLPSWIQAAFSTAQIKEFNDQLGYNNVSYTW